MAASTPRRSILKRSWRVVSAAPRANFRTAWQMLDTPGIKQSWTMMRDVQRQALKPTAASSGIRLIEKDGRLDAEGTRRWMESYARDQLEAGRTTQDVVHEWMNATPYAVVAWAAHEVRNNRLSVYFKIGKAAACGLAALLSAWLVRQPQMALMSSIALVLLFIFFAIIGVRAIQNQIYLEALIRKDGTVPSFPPISMCPQGALVPPRI